MAIFSGPEITNNGLVLHLDAANYRSKSYNVISNSENLSSLLSLRAGAVVTSNSTTAPDGTQTADLITGTGSGFGYYTPLWPVGNATHSWFLKPNGATTTFNFSHAGTGWGGTFNFSTKQFSSLSNYSGSYEQLPNGWYLVSFHTTNETNNYYAEMSFNSNDGAYIWGVQLTPFSYYRPYISQSAGAISSTVWSDLSGLSNTGTLTNSPTYNSDSGGSIAFDGVDDYASVTNPATLRNQNFTVSVWFNPGIQTNGIVSMVDFDHASGPSQGWVLQSEDANTNRNFYLAWYTGTQFQPTGGGGFGSGKGIQITTSVWQNIVYSKNGTSLLGYMNGMQVYTGTATDSTVSYPINRNLRVGNWVQDTARGFNGRIAQVLIHNRALASTEIQQNFEATRGRYGI